jgi:hypothetical protein
MVGMFRQTQEQFAAEFAEISGRENSSSEEIARKMRDFQSELENAKQALNSVEAKISASRQTLVVGAHRRTMTPNFNGVHLDASPAANFSRRVVAFSAQAKAQAESLRVPENFFPPNDRIAQEDA